MGEAQQAEERDLSTDKRTPANAYRPVKLMT
jgi:hypothetical protein